MAKTGELCDIYGRCVDASEDEVFRLTTLRGKLAVALYKTTTSPDTLGSVIFDQAPTQIFDTLLPLYLNSTILRSIQESLASELAARMTAMSSASDNAASLKKKLSLIYNRYRQTSITTQIIEI